MESEMPRVNYDGDCSSIQNPLFRMTSQQISEVAQNFVQIHVIFIEFILNNNRWNWYQILYMRTTEVNFLKNSGVFLKIFVKTHKRISIWLTVTKRKKRRTRGKQIILIDSKLYTTGFDTKWFHIFLLNEALWNITFVTLWYLFADRSTDWTR